MVIQGIVLNVNYIDIVVGIVGMIFKAFALYVVYEFIKEIRLGGQTIHHEYIIPGAA